MFLKGAKLEKNYALECRGGFLVPAQYGYMLPHVSRLISMLNLPGVNFRIKMKKGSHREHL